MNKKELRITYLTQRNLCSLEKQQFCSEQICKKIINSSEYIKSHKIGIYKAFNKEIDLSMLWEHALVNSKNTYFPIVQNNYLLFGEATRATKWTRNQFKIYEPQIFQASTQNIITADQLDLLILPLVIFDKYCHRLGMGKGYYDRTLAISKPKWLFGAAYEFQYINKLPIDPWDIALHKIFTEENCYISEHG